MDISVKEYKIIKQTSFDAMSRGTRSLFGFSISYAFLYRELTSVDRKLWLLDYKKSATTVLADMLQESILRNIVRGGGGGYTRLVDHIKIHCKLISDGYRSNSYSGILDYKVRDYLDGRIVECVPVMDGDCKVSNSIHEYCMDSDWTVDDKDWIVTKQLRSALDSMEDERLRNYIHRMVYSISTLLITEFDGGPCPLRVTMPVHGSAAIVPARRKPYRKVLVLGSALEFDSIFGEDVRRITRPVSRIIRGDFINVVLIYHPSFDLSDVQWPDIQYGILGETTGINIDAAERQFLDKGIDLYHLGSTKGVGYISRGELREEILFRSGNMKTVKGCEAHVVR